MKRFIVNGIIVIEIYECPTHAPATIAPGVNRNVIARTKPNHNPNPNNILRLFYILLNDSKELLDFRDFAVLLGYCRYNWDFVGTK